MAPTKKRRRRAEPLEATPSMLRLLRYPVAGGDLSAHSDFECFTFVHQRVAGLEVQVDGAWRCLAASADDSFCVLLAGDALHLDQPPLPHLARREILHVLRRDVVHGDGRHCD